MNSSECDPRCEHFVVKLKPMPQVDDPDGHRRLRMALKFIGRRFRLQCVEVRAVRSGTESVHTEPNDVEEGGQHR